MTIQKRSKPVAAGILAGAAQLAAGELCAALLPSARAPLSGLGRTLVDLTPGPAVDMTVATAEELDKPLLRASLVAVWLGSGVLGERSGPAGALPPLALGAIAGAAAATRPLASPASSLIAGLTGGATGAATLRALGRHRAGERPPTGRVIAATAAAASVAEVLRRRHLAARAAGRSAVSLPAPAHPAPPPPPGAELDVAGLSPLFTPPREFYVTDVSFPAPRVDPTGWRLRVCGLVERELHLSLDDLLAMDLVELDATLVCVHNPVGGPRIGTGRWLGVPVAELLDRAGVRPEAEQLVARSLDGFTAGVPVARIARGLPAIVAVGLGGEPLPFANGFPARLLVPGLWGADANTKWLGELELTSWEAVRDYWDSRGWPRQSSPVRPGSRIDVPAPRARLTAGPATIAGMAWAPPFGVELVEVSIDSGPWREAELGAELAPTAWRGWRVPWRAEPGRHAIRARAIGRRDVQGEALEPPYPRGSSGYAESVVVVAPPGREPSAARAAAARLGDAGAEARRRLRLATMAPGAWVRHGFPRRPAFDPPGVGRDVSG